jgi:hypothetical protein
MRLEVPSARSPGYFLIISEFCFGCRSFLIRMLRIKIIEDLLHDPQSPASPSRQMRDGLRDKAYARRSELQRQTKCLRRRFPTHWREAIVAPVPSNASRNVLSRRGAFVRPRRFTRSFFLRGPIIKCVNCRSVAPFSTGLSDGRLEKVTAGDLDHIGAPAQVRAHHHHFAVTQTALARAGVRWRRSPCRS